MRSRFFSLLPRFLSVAESHVDPHPHMPLLSRSQVLIKTREVSPSPKSPTLRSEKTP